MADGNTKKITLSDIFPKYTKEYFDDLESDKESDKILDDLAAFEEELEEESGIVLTKKDRVALIGIVKDYSPKDKKGDYFGDWLPFDYAWKLYKAKIMNKIERNLERYKNALK